MSLVTVETADSNQLMTSSREVRREVGSLARKFCTPMIAGLAIRLIISLVWLGNTEPYNDAADYFEEATNVAHGTREAIAFYWPPGTTYYLAGWFKLFGSTFTAARLAMIVLSTIQIPVVGLMTWYATSSRRNSLLACWLWALYPPSLFLSFQPFSQHLAALSLALIGLCGVAWIHTRSWKLLVIQGVCIGIGCLTRPSMMSVALLSGISLMIVSFATRESWMTRIRLTLIRCSLLTVPAVLVLLPTVIHNVRCGAGYTLSTNNERNFFLGNNPHTPWYKTGLFAQRTLDELPEEVQSYLKSFYRAPNRRTAMTRAASEHIVQNPGLTALRTMNRARAFWGFDYLASRVVLATTGSRVASAIVLFMEAGGYCAIMMLAFVGLAFWKRELTGKATIWFMAVIIAYAFPYCLAFSGGTYHFPVMGLAIPLAAVGVNVLMTTSLMRVLKSRGLAIAMIFFVAIQVEYVYFTLAAGISRSPETEPPRTVQIESAKEI